MIATDLGKQQALDADMKATQQIDVTGNVDRAGNTTFFIIEEVKRFFFFLIFFFIIIYKEIVNDFIFSLI